MSDYGDGDTRQVDGEGGGDLVLVDDPAPPHVRRITLNRPEKRNALNHPLRGQLVAGCDLVYVAHDAKMGYPAVRFGVPDMQFHAWLLGMRAAMEMMMTGDSISGDEAVRLGWANRAFPADRLDTEVLAVAQRIAQLPPDIVTLNKRTVHRAMDHMGIRHSIRAGTELCSLGTKQPSFVELVERMRSKGLTTALQERDEPFGDYRTAEPHPPT